MRKTIKESTIRKIIRKELLIESNQKSEENKNYSDASAKLKIVLNKLLSNNQTSISEEEKEFIIAVNMNLLFTLKQNPKASADLKGLGLDSMNAVSLANRMAQSLSNLSDKQIRAHINGQNRLKQIQSQHLKQFVNHKDQE